MRGDLQTAIRRLEQGIERREPKFCNDLAARPF